MRKLFFGHKFFFGQKNYFSSLDFSSGGTCIFKIYPGAELEGV